MGIDLKDTLIIITINAKDATSFRASINSAIKLIDLSSNVNDLVNDLK